MQTESELITVLILLLSLFVLDMLHKSRAYDSSRDGDHANAEDGDEGADDTTDNRYGIDVTISDGSQSGDCPPESRECVFEIVRLSIMFRVVNQKRSNYKQQNNNKEGYENLPCLALEYSPDGVERIRISVEFEDAQETNEPKGPKSQKNGWKKEVEIEREDCQQIDDRHP